MVSKTNAVGNFVPLDVVVTLATELDTTEILKNCEKNCTSIKKGYFFNENKNYLKPEASLRDDASASCNEFGTDKFWIETDFKDSQEADKWPFQE